MNKKGSHVGMVLSFVVFITFLFLLWTILSPSIQVEKSKQGLLDYLKVSLIEDRSINVSIATIVVNNGVSIDGSCFSIDDFDVYGKVIAKNGADTIIGAQRQAGKLKIAWNNDGNKFFKIYYAENLDETSVDNGCLPLSDNEYTIGSLVKSDYVSLPKIYALQEDYKKYETLKQRYNIPNETDFDFSFTDSADNELAKGHKEQTAQNVYSEEIPVQYIDDYANIKYGFLKLRVW